MRLDPPDIYDDGILQRPNRAQRLAPHGKIQSMQIARDDKMASLLMKIPSPWGGACDAPYYNEALRSADARSTVEDRDGMIDSMDDGLVCLLFDD